MDDFSAVDHTHVHQDTNKACFEHNTRTLSLSLRHALLEAVPVYCIKPARYTALFKRLLEVGADFSPTVKDPDTGKMTPRGPKRLAFDLLLLAREKLTDDECTLRLADCYSGRPVNQDPLYVNCPSGTFLDELASPAPCR